MIRLLTESDLDAADRIFRVAFGTFLGLPDPSAFAAGRGYIPTRWKASPEGALAAEIDGELVGTNFVTRWGSFGFFGPLTIKPELWNKGVAQQLLAPTIELFDSWGVREAGLFTFPHSTKHIALYQKFGFWPRFLTALMAKAPVAYDAVFTRFSSLNTAQQGEIVAAMRRLTDSIFDGLDVSREILAVEHQKLGDTIVVSRGDSVGGFAVCHCGAGSEAGPGNCYVKFAAADSQASFDRLLDACESFAVERGLQRIEAGVNLAREEAYRAMLGRGFRSFTQGVAMQRPNAPGFNRAGVFVIDDWR